MANGDITKNAFVLWKSSIEESSKYYKYLLKNKSEKTESDYRLEYWKIKFVVNLLVGYDLPDFDELISKAKKEQLEGNKTKHELAVEWFGAENADWVIENDLLK